MEVCDCRLFTFLSERFCMQDLQNRASATVRQFVRLMLLLRPFWPGLRRTIAMNGFLSLLGFIPPLLAKLLFDSVYPQHDTRLLLAVVAVTFGVTMGSAILGGIKSFAAQVTNSGIDIEMSQRFFEHAMGLKVRYYDLNHAGSIHARLTDVRSSLSMLLRVIDLFFISTMQLLLVPAALFMLDWRLALISLAAIPITTAISTVSSQLQKPWSRLIAEHSASVTSLQIEAYTNVRTLKLLNAEPFLATRLRDLQGLLKQIQLRSSLLSSTTAVANAFASGLATAVFTYVGWREVLSGSLTVGGLMAFSSYSRLLSAPFNGFASIAVDIQRASVAMGRVFEFFDSPLEEQRSLITSAPRGLLSLDRVERIELRDVGYDYGQGTKIFERFSTTIERGQSIAIVGESGAGKSTLVRLLARLDQPTQGTILVNGVDCARYSLSAYRSAVAVVWQEPSMFTGTLEENLMLGLPSAARPNVQQALSISQLQDFVRGLPEGLDTRVGQGGSTLSGGQRQRVALARAILRNPDVLILDEATANIDEPTEGLILKALLHQFRERILIFVTHRSSTTQLASRRVSVGRMPDASASADVRMLRPDSSEQS